MTEDTKKRHTGKQGPRTLEKLRGPRTLQDPGPLRIQDSRGQRDAKRPRTLMDPERNLEDPGLQKTHKPRGPRTTTSPAQNISLMSYDRPRKQDYFLPIIMVLELRRFHVKKLKQDTTKTYFLHYGICIKTLCTILQLLLYQNFSTQLHLPTQLCFQQKRVFMKFGFFISRTKQI